jgi:hypothetical protein
MVGANRTDADKAEDVGPPVIDDWAMLRPDWRVVMIRFRNRLMLATDVHKPQRWADHANVVRRWRLILLSFHRGRRGRLPSTRGAAPRTLRLLPWQDAP